MERFRISFSRTWRRIRTGDIHHPRISWAGCHRRRQSPVERERDEHQTGDGGDLLAYNPGSSPIRGAAGMRPRPPFPETGPPVLVVVASFSETLIFINDPGSQHLQLISGGILRETLRARTRWRWCTFYPIISSFQSHHLIMGSSLWLNGEQKHTSLPGVGTGPPAPAEGHQNTRTHKSRDGK